MKSTKSFSQIIAATGIIFFFATFAAAQKSSSLSAKEKKDIIKHIFDDGFEKLMDEDRFLQCTIPIINEKKIILIQTDEPHIFPKELGDYEFKFMSKKQIEDEIKSNDGDCYFDISQLKKISTNHITFSLWRWIKVITVIDGKSLYPSNWTGGSGLVYEAVKTKRKWKVKFLNSTALVQ